MKDNFSKGSIEFLTVAVEFCKFIEQAEDLQPDDFTNKLSKLLPFLYLKAALAEPNSACDEGLDHSVDELTYTSVRNALEGIFGERDRYLTASHPDIKLSDTVINASIAEDVADVYQSVKNFVDLARLGDEDLLDCALAECKNDFREYWGSRLLNALVAIHEIVTKSNIASQE
ncbi:MAG: DUF5063 domain-containing protein [bacterium]|nr:DUF5063 domain-containing protein [Candidatus Minthenecus merdequi]